MATNNHQNQEQNTIENPDTDTNDIHNQGDESMVDSGEKQNPTNKTFLYGSMTFCVAVFLVFFWVWHHQSQFNDNYRKASFLMQNGEPEQAIKAYQIAIKNKNRTIFFKYAPSAYNNLGQAYMFAGQYEEAINILKKAIEIAPDIPEGYVNLATVYLKQNEPANAREICKHALQTFPKTGLLHYNLSCAYALTGEPQNAKNSLLQAFDLAPELREFALKEGALKQIIPLLSQ